MPKERQEYKPIKRDSKGNYIPEKDHNSIKGDCVFLRQMGFKGMLRGT